MSNHARTLKTTSLIKEALILNIGAWFDTYEEQVIIIRRMDTLVWMERLIIMIC